MRPQSTIRLAAALLPLSFSPLASAWPNWLPDAASLVVRQDSSTPAASATATATATSPKSTTSNASQTGSATGTAAITVTSGSGANTASSANATTHTTFDQQDGAGSVAMITPAPTDSTQLYKVGDYVTWAWNYTNLQAAPTAIDVLISCSVATRTWTLTQNMTFATRVDFLWDTNDNKGTPYLVEDYTLLIHDSDSGVSATAEAGYLAAFSGYTFGVYTKADYTPLASGWQCVSCSGAASSMDKRAFGLALFTSAITVLTFTWFVTGLGVGL